MRRRFRHCEPMTLRCRPRGSGDPYAAAMRGRTPCDARKSGGYGSPPARGRQRMDSCQGHLSTLHSRPVLAKAGMRGDERSSWLGRALLGAACLAFGHTIAAAEPVADFYRGKTITIYVGTGVGAGAVSAYPMALAP